MRALPQRGALLKAIRLPCRVRPLARPRFSNGRFGAHVYQPLENQRDLRQFLTMEPQLMLNRPVIVDSYAYFEQSKRLKFPASRVYGDEDNLRKAILDGLQAARIIVDDALVVGGENFKLFGPRDCAVIRIFAAVGAEEEEVAA